MPATKTSLFLAAALCATAHARVDGFVHFESPHVHPLELTPDGSRLLAVNTADARLEVFDVLPMAPYLRHAGSIAVGLEPVSVRARTSGEAWVVNHVSDTVSIVDLASMSLKATLLTGDEPCDVVFAGKPERAFVSVSQLNRLEAFNPAALAQAPTIVAIAGEDPRALATDGQRVYCAIFESGNESTIVPRETVSSPLNPYAGAPNPPPNAGAAFSPPLNPTLPPPPPSALIVRKDADGAWRDVNGADWSSAVPWQLHGNDMAVVDASNLATSYVRGLMTTPMGVVPLPSGGVAVIGVELLNEVRFDQNLQATFVRSEVAFVPQGAAEPATRGDLNPHLDYQTRSLPLLARAVSIGDPRGLAISADGTRGYAAGMGSSNLVAFAVPSLARLATTAVGEGPTAVTLDAARARLYTLNRFDGSISVVDEATLVELARPRFFDPTPPIVKAGRPFLFDTHLTSGLGQASCASCHIDARTDQLVWDLGSPASGMAAFDQLCNLNLPNEGVGCTPWHPVKGPMATQSLIGLEGTEPFHWRGDRAYIATFAHTGAALQGMDRDFTEEEFKDLQDYLNSISLAPNPNRTLDGALPHMLAGGNPARGQSLFFAGGAGFAACAQCHTPPSGGGAGVMSVDVLGEVQAFTVPHLTAIHEKTGFAGSEAVARGFGFGHDGSARSISEFLAAHVKAALGTAISETDRRDLTAFLLAWDTGTHASVGAQTTLGGRSPNASGRRNLLASIAAAGNADMVARTKIDGVERSFVLANGVFESDRAGAPLTVAQLDALATKSNTVTFTLVPAGTGMRALDRDDDGFRDADERDACSDPADPASVPNDPCRADIAGGDAIVNGADLAALLSAWGSDDPVANLDCSGVVDAADLTVLLSRWGPGR
ncbi:MAG: YncE family protein [Phycisphaerales bacterium]